MSKDRNSKTEFAKYVAAHDAMKQLLANPAGLPTNVLYAHWQGTITPEEFTAVMQGGVEQGAIIQTGGTKTNINDAVWSLNPETRESTENEESFFEMIYGDPSDPKTLRVNG